MSLTPLFDNCSYEGISVDYETNTLEISGQKHSLSGPYLRIFAAFINLANDQDSTGRASIEYMKNLLGYKTQGSFKVCLSNLRKELKEIKLKNGITAEALLIGDKIHGQLPEGFETKPYRFNTELAIALKEGTNLDCIRTTFCSTIGNQQHPQAFKAAIGPAVHHE